MVNPLGAGDLQENKRSFKLTVKKKRITYNFPSIEIILPLSTISFETWTHVHASAYNGDGILQTFRYGWIVHKSLGYGFLALGFASFQEL